MRRILVPSLPGESGRIRLDGPTSHHLGRVLRLADGADVVLVDGRGGRAPGRLHLGRDVSEVVQVGPGSQAPAPTEVHLLLGLLKGPAMDDAVRMATEAGVTHLRPLLLDRSVPTDGRPDRWDRIARAAAEQCGRPDLPTLHPPAPLAAVLGALTHVPDRRVAVPGAPRGRPTQGPVAVAVGPEGGLSPTELEHLLAEGFTPLGLGPFTLRAATAAPLAVAAVTGWEVEA